jgi:hypothetical protein
MYNARGLRGPLLESMNSEHPARAMVLLYDDAHVRAADARAQGPLHTVLSSVRFRWSGSCAKP